MTLICKGMGFCPYKDIKTEFCTKETVKINQNYQCLSVNEYFAGLGETSKEELRMEEIEWLSLQEIHTEE